MGVNLITERQIIGSFYKALNADAGAGWIPEVSNLFTSDQASEQYAWLGQSPAMREWVGGRNAKGFRENNLTIVNKHFEGTMKVLLRDLRRDKTAQVMTRINDLARRTNSHWASLLSTLIAAGASTACYDGQYFFDTDHSEGDSGTQSNSITIDISTLPVAVAGTVTAPSVEEMQICIAQAIQQIAGFKDDQGEPMNEDASRFLVMVPMAYMNSAMQAVFPGQQVDASQTVLEALQKRFAIDVVPNTRLSAWESTYNFAVFRTDAAIKSFIRQEETAVSLKVKGAGSEYEFDEDAHMYGVDAWRNVGYGYWQNSCLVTMA